MAIGRCLVLNADHQFLNITGRWYDTFKLMSKNKIIPLKTYPQPVRAERQLFELPAVAVLREYKPTPSKRSIFNYPTHRVVLVRDKFRCQYCNTKLSFGASTKDHVFPRSRGGKDTLLNVVAACKACNGRKADRTPEEAGMALLSQPRALTEDEKLELIVKVHKSHERQLWRECLEEEGIKMF
jgi:5-methylcytosine-specific restriction endonuclease McrA